MPLPRRRFLRLALLNQEIISAVATPEVKERFAGAWLRAGGDETARHCRPVKQEVPKWGGVVRAAGINAD